MPPVTDTPSTVLIVDDDQMVAELYGTWLADDYTVQTVYDGEAALNSISDSIDVILLDRQIPEPSGDTLVEYITEQEIDCRVAMVTGTPPDFDVLELGFDDYLRKPVTREELTGVVDRLDMRSAYNETVCEYFAAARKQAILDLEKSAAELADSEEYSRLQRRVQELRHEVNHVVSELDEGDFRALFHDFNQSATP